MKAPRIRKQFTKRVGGRWRKYVRCECACGRLFTTRADRVRSGHSRTCGKCGQRARLRLKNKTPLFMAAKRAGIPYHTAYRRVMRGWTTDEAVRPSLRMKS